MLLCCLSTDGHTKAVRKFCWTHVSCRLSTLCTAVRFERDLFKFDWILIELEYRTVRASPCKSSHLILRPSQQGDKLLVM
jgi:hypothetical protein